jgi:Holliday junction resolvasome RuvABC endonuclease subunit
VIWGLDIATRCTGITAGDGAAKPAIGVWQYDYCGNDLAHLLEAFDKDIESLAGRFPPRMIMYEAPLLLPSDKLLVLRKIYSMGAYLELWARRRQVRVEEASPQALKKRLTGSHKASKDEMVRMVRQLGMHLPNNDTAKDMADSFAAWMVGLTYHGNKAHLTRWDQALYGRRGFLA